MRTALYARVSCRHQDPTHQLGPLRAAAAARGATTVAEFVDVASGRRGSRPQLDRLLAAARAGQLDLVLAVRVDRLGRSVRHLSNLVAELTDLGVRVATADGSVDTGAGATGRLLVNLLASIGEFELELQRERVEAARANGHPPGRPRSLTPEQVERVRALRSASTSWTRIADEVGCSVGAARRAVAAA